MRDTGQTGADGGIVARSGNLEMLSPFVLGRCVGAPGGNPKIRDMQCGNVTWGLKVKPTKGSSLLFYSLRPDGAVDAFSEHASA